MSHDVARQCDDCVQYNGVGCLVGNDPAACFGTERLEATPVPRLPLVSIDRPASLTRFSQDVIAN